MGVRVFFGALAVLGICWVFFWDFRGLGGPGVRGVLRFEGFREFRV